MRQSRETGVQTVSRLLSRLVHKISCSKMILAQLNFAPFEIDGELFHGCALTHQGRNTERISY